MSNHSNQEDLFGGRTVEYVDPKTGQATKVQFTEEQNASGDKYPHQTYGTYTDPNTGKETTGWHHSPSKDGERTAIPNPDPNVYPNDLND